jgi:hypothetical protein
MVVLAALTSLPGCGGKSPIRADGSGLPLVPGQQLLTLTGFAASADPAFPPCSPVGLPRDGTSVNTVVILSTENGGWVARSSANLGTIELRLRSDGASPTGYVVSGTITGAAVDVGLMGVTRDVRVTLASSGGGAATFDGGTVSQSSSLIVGRVSGTVQFTDSQGVSSTCQAVRWSMQPY